MDVDYYVPDWQDELDKVVDEIIRERKRRKKFKQSEDACKKCGTMGEVVLMCCKCPQCGETIWGC